jgi:hypothetical protein
VIAVAILVAIALWWIAPPGADLAVADSDLEHVRAAFREGRGDLWVTLEGQVERTLSDDRDGSRHQRFVLRLAEDLTVLVAHNIDLAPRVPLQPGDRLRLRGEYGWNERGGVVHWTHHDPAGAPGGWIDFDGRRYE